MADNEFGNLFGCDSQGRDPAGPVEARGSAGKVGEGPQIVGEVSVATPHHIPVRGGQGGLQSHDPRRPLGELVGLAAEDQCKHPGEMAGVGAQDRGVLIVAVVGLVRQSQAGLAQMHQIAGGVLGVGVDVEPDTPADAGALQRSDHRGQLVRSGGGIDERHLVEQGTQTPVADAHVVEEARVEVADALLIGGLHIGALGRLHDEFPHLFLGPVVKQPERAIGGAVGRDRVVGQPAAVHMAEQVVLGADAGILMGQVDSGTLSVYRHATIHTMRGSLAPCPRRIR